MTALPILHSATRCDGACCRAFVLNSYSKRAFEALVIAEVFAGASEERLRELGFILDMIVPIVGENPSASRARQKSWISEEDHRFTCRHFDGHNCTAYEERPNLCRDYPYGHPCEHGDACTWKEGAAITRLQRDASFERAARGHPHALPEPCTNRLYEIVRRGLVLKLARELTISPPEWAA